MGLETVTNISDLVATNPTSADPKSQGDDHIRNIKTALLNDFAGFTGAIAITGTDGGTVNAYTLTPARPLVAYGLRMVVIFSPAITNTGASTMNISGLGAIAIKQVQGVDTVAGDLVAGYVYAALYNGTELRLLSPTKNYMDQLAISATLPNQTGNATKLLRTDGATANWDVERLYRSVRTSNTIIGVSDGGRMLDYTSGNFTQTWSDTAVLGEGFVIRLRNSSATDSVEIVAPATNTTTSTTSNSIAAGTAWTVATGLTINAGDLVNIRRTADPYNQRVIGTAASYNSGTGLLTINSTQVRIGSGTFTDWTITTRPAGNGIDGLGSYELMPGEVRDFMVSGTAITSVIISPFKKTYTTLGKNAYGPGYKEIGGRLYGSGNSGQKSGNVAVASAGGAGCGAFPINLPTTLIGPVIDVTIGAGGLPVSGTANGNIGGNTSINNIMTIFNNSTFRRGGSIRSGLVMSGANAVGFEGGDSAASVGYSAVWGGAGTAQDGSTVGSSIHGGGAGGSLTSAAAVVAPGTSVTAGNGGVASSTGNGADGAFPGGGGGATQTGAQSGAGAAGKVDVWGVV